MTTIRSFFLFVFVLALAGCGGEEKCLDESCTQEGGVSLTFSLAAVESPLQTDAIKYFRIRVYPSAPVTEDEDTLFDSLEIHNCFPAGGTEIKIQDLKAGEDRFVYYEGFSDDTCSKRVAIGIRGGIRIEEKSALQTKAEEQACTEDSECAAIHPDAKCDCAKGKSDGKTLPYCDAGGSGFCSVTAPVYVPLFDVGKFNKLPVASADLLAKATKESCDTDQDCQSKVHKAAVCNQDLGYCTVEGLFPFAPSRPRAFHTAEVLKDGRVLLSGGFTQQHDGDAFSAGAPFFEVFNPRTGLFEAASVEANFGGQNVGLHSSAVLEGKKVVVSGGVNEVRLGYEQGTELKFKMTIPTQYDYGCPDAPCNNFSNGIVSADLSNGAVLAGVLPRRVMAHRLGVVNKGSDPYLVLSGGMTHDVGTNAFSSSDRYVLCGAADISGGDKIVCEEGDSTTLSAPRYSHADACLVQQSATAACDEYLLFGGVSSEQPAGEEFSSSGSDAFNKALTFSEVTKLNEALFPLLARVEQDPGSPAKLYAFGGLSEGGLVVQNAQDSLSFLFAKPDIVPQKIAVNLTTASLTTAALDLTDLDPAGEVFRLFQTVSVIEGGRIMVAGGIGEDNLPTKSVLFFEDPKTDALTFVGKASLKEARFGHQATVLTEGLLAGAVLVSGGLTVDKSTGTVLFAKSSEIYIP
jgi:hypothetical protein